MQCASSTTSSPQVAASRGSTSSRKPGLLSRSGLTSSTSTSPALICVVDRLPVLDVGRVDRDRPDAGALGRGDLVAHQGEQRRDDHGRAGALARAAAGWPRSRPPTCPSRCAARPGRGGGRPPAPRSPSTGPRAARRRRARPAPAGALGRGADVGPGGGHRTLSTSDDRPRDHPLHRVPRGRACRAPHAGRVRQPPFPGLTSVAGSPLPASPGWATRRAGLPSPRRTTTGRGRGGGRAGSGRPRRPGARVGSRGSP